MTPKVLTKTILRFLSAALLTCAACRPAATESTSTGAPVTDSTRIVSLSGTTTEVLAALGLEPQIVGVDVTSTFPERIQQLPKVGHNRNMNAEAIVALRPQTVVGLESQVKPELMTQLRDAGIRVVTFPLTYSLDGAQKLVAAMADSFQASGKVSDIQITMTTDAQKAPVVSGAPKVLFIYARGAGTMMVAGDHTPMKAIIELTGAQNAVTGFEEFKPLTSEGLIAANPDVILLFDSGLESLGGLEGLLNVPGVAQTIAGRTKAVVEMDGQLLTGFGPRTGQAITELATKINQAIASRN